MTSHRFFDFSNWGPLQYEMKDKFTDGAQWPIGRPALAALKDLGMSDATIAEYFKIEAGEVAELRRRYGI